MTRLASLVIAMLLIACGGCANVAQQESDQGVADYFMGDYTRAVERIKPAAAKTDENFVLNNDRLASAALAIGDFDTAESALLRSYEVINSVGVNNGGRSLGAALVSENIKVWKGEPFERAMVNFYLGVIYYIRHDYGNARGAFENALFKLRDYGQEDKADQYREVESNFTLGYLMLAKCYQRLGKDDLAKTNFDRVVALRPDFAPLADAKRNADSNLLLIVDFGRGPEKLSNDDGAFVGYRPSPRQAGPIPLPAIVVDGARINLDQANFPPLDLLALAQDRRWESIDSIRAIKSVLGTGLVAGGVGTALLRQRADPAVSLGLIAGGLLLKATSQADLRQWEMLPRTVFVLPMKLAPGKHDVTLEFPAFAGFRKLLKGVDVPESGDATYFVHIERYNSSAAWPAYRGEIVE